MSSFPTRLVSQGTKANWCQRRIWSSCPDGCVRRIMTWELDDGTPEHNHRWLRRLIDNFLSTWCEVCSSVTWGSLPDSVLFVIFLPVTWVETMLITFSAATKWGGVANSTDDRTKAQWNQQAGTVSENGMQIGRKGNLALGANSKISNFTMGDMRLGEKAGKRGLIFFFPHAFPNPIGIFEIMKTLKFQKSVCLCHEVWWFYLPLHQTTPGVLCVDESLAFQGVH